MPKTKTPEERLSKVEEKLEDMLEETNNNRIVSPWRLSALLDELGKIPLLATNTRDNVHQIAEGQLTLLKKGKLDPITSSIKTDIQYYRKENSNTGDMEWKDNVTLEEIQELSNNIEEAEATISKMKEFVRSSSLDPDQQEDTINNLNKQKKWLKEQKKIVNDKKFELEHPNLHQAKKVPGEIFSSAKKSMLGEYRVVKNEEGDLAESMSNASTVEYKKGHLHKVKKLGKIKDYFQSEKNESADHGADHGAEQTPAEPTQTKPNRAKAFIQEKGSDAQKNKRIRRATQKARSAYRTVEGEGKQRLSIYESAQKIKKIKAKIKTVKAELSKDNDTRAEQLLTNQLRELNEELGAEQGHLAKLQTEENSRAFTSAATIEAVEKQYKDIGDKIQVIRGKEISNIDVVELVMLKEEIEDFHQNKSAYEARMQADGMEDKIGWGTSYAPLLTAQLKFFEEVKGLSDQKAAELNTQIISKGDEYSNLRDNVFKDESPNIEDIETLLKSHKELSKLLDDRIALLKSDTIATDRTKGEFEAHSKQVDNFKKERKQIQKKLDKAKNPKLAKAKSVLRSAGDALTGVPGAIASRVSKPNDKFDQLEQHQSDILDASRAYLEKYDEMTFSDDEGVTYQWRQDITDADHSGLNQLLSEWEKAVADERAYIEATDFGSPEVKEKLLSKCENREAEIASLKGGSSSFEREVGDALGQGGYGNTGMPGSGRMTAGNNNIATAAGHPKPEGVQPDQDSRRTWTPPTI